MRDRIFEGVKIACENWLAGEMNFEAAVKFIKSYPDDPCVTIAIARETMNYFRTTRDLEKTQAAIMSMRLAKFNKSLGRSASRATLSLTIPGKGLIGKIDL